MPARALGPKAARIHAERKQRIKEAPGIGAVAQAGERRFATEDRALSYLVRGVSGGLYIERHQRRPLGAEVIQSMVFPTLREFMHWCDADPLRFDDPVLHAGCGGAAKSTSVSDGRWSAEAGVGAFAGVGGEGNSLREQTAGADYATRVVDVMARIATAADAASVVELLRLATTRLGADAAIFTSFVRDDSSLSSFRYLLACDPVWALEYAKNGWCFDDPWLHYALYNAEPIRSGELPPSTERERCVSEAAAQWGFKSAAIVPVASPAAQSRVGMLCLGSYAERRFDDDGYPAFRCLARTLACELADWMHRRIRDELIARARITDEDLALLRHEQQGHGSKVIAAAVSTEVSTIDCRFHRLSLRLGTANRRAAVRLAEIYGLI